MSDVRQLADKCLRMLLREWGSRDGCVLLQTGQGKGISQIVVQGLSARTVDLLMAEPLRSYLANAAQRWGELMVFSNLRAPETFHAWHREPLSGSFLGILKAEGLRTAVLIGLGTPEECYGALLLATRDVRTLTSAAYDLRLALAVGKQLSASLKQWVAKRMTERQQEELRGLYRLGLALRETFDFRTQIEMLRRETKGIWGNREFALYLQPSPHGPLNGAVPFESEWALDLSRGSSDGNLEDHVLRTRAPLVVSEDWRGGTAFPHDSPASPRVRSWAGVPFALTDGSVGVLAMADYHVNITPQHVDLLQVIAKEASKAFENARSFSYQKEQATRLAVLNELGQRAASVLHPKELLNEVCQHAQAAFGSESAYVAVVEREGNKLVVEAQAGIETAVLDQHITLGEGPAGTAACEGHTVLADFTAAEPQFVAPQPGIRSGLSVPLKLDDLLLGVFNLESRREHAFSPQDVQMAESLARQIALALHNANAYQTALEQSITDGLTGAKTHRYFMEAVEREWRRSTRSGQNFCLIMLDLDKFKEVNDRYGHPQGDMVLRAVADVLSESVRQSNVVARYGGDEFAILIPEATLAQARVFAERMRANIENHPLLRTHGITASIGMAAFPDHGPTKEEVLRAADGAMYLAKLQAGNCVRLAVGDAPESATDAQDFPTVGAGVGGQVFSTGPEAFSEYLRRIERASQMGLGELHLLDTVTSLARAIDFSDQHTRDHGQAVARWAAQIARELKLSYEDIEEVRLAGILHDIGKVGIPQYVLVKPAPLSQEEYECMKSHCVLGERILGPLQLSSIKRIARMVRHHHETYDGGGYPDRLKGEDIPLGARILAIADSFDTIVSDRSYRKRRTYRDAVLELHRCSGKQFDPQIVASLLRADAQLQRLSTQS